MASGNTKSSMAQRLYLSVYNWVSFFVWTQVLCYAILALLESGYKTVYTAVEGPLLLTQVAGLMEILHSVVGLVRSPLSATVPQVIGRMFIAWGVLWSFPETFGFAPSWLVWLRYSTFIVLYPTGSLSEAGLIYAALPYMKASEKYCLRMPKKWNFSFNYYYASALNIPVYILGFPYLHRDMLGRRRKGLVQGKNCISTAFLVLSSWGR